MRRLLLFAMLNAALATGCKKDTDKKTDSSSTIFEADPSWERVGTIPWQAGPEGSFRSFSAASLRMTPSGQLSLAYCQHGTGSEWPVYKALVSPGADAVAAVSSAGISIQYEGKTPVLFLDEKSGEVSACISTDKELAVVRPDGTLSSKMRFASLDDPLGASNEAPRFLPRFYSGGNLVYDDFYGLPRSTASFYSATARDWMTRTVPAHLKAFDWCTFQVKDGPFRHCVLESSNDSLFLSVSTLNTATNAFEPDFRQLLPEFSGKVQGRAYAILSFNDQEKDFVIAIAEFDNGHPREVSVYKMTDGAKQFSTLYANVTLPAYSSPRFQDWGTRNNDFQLTGKSACTTDGQLYDMVLENNYYYLVTVDAAGFRERAKFKASSAASIRQWPVFYLNKAFFLLAQNGDYPTRNENLRMEILRVR